MNEKLKLIENIDEISEESHEELSNGKGEDDE